MGLVIRHLLTLISVNALLFSAHNNHEKAVNPLDYVTNSADIRKLIAGYAAEPLDCVTHVPEVQKIIAGYLDQEWVAVTEFPKKNIEAFACSPDGKYIAYILKKEKKNKLEIWDQETGSITDPAISRDCVLAEDIELLFSPRSQTLLVSHKAGVELFTPQFKNSHKPPTWVSVPLAVQKNREIMAIALSSDGKYIAFLCNGDKVDLYEFTRTKDLSLKKTFSFFGGLKNLVFTSDNTKILIFSSHLSTVEICDITTETDHTWLLPQAPMMKSLAVLPTAHCIAIPDGEKVISYNLVTGQKIVYGTNEHFVTAIAVINNNYIAWNPINDAVRIVDISQSGQDVTSGFERATNCVQKIKKTAHIASLHCSANGKYLTAEHINGLIKRWVNLSHYLLEKYEQK